MFTADSVNGQRLETYEMKIRILLVAAVTTLFVTAVGSGSYAEGPTVTGAGSTWSQVAIDQWRADVARRGLTVNYKGVGSSSGRNFYLINETDFAVSEIPFDDAETKQLNDKGKSFQYFPIVAGGTSFMYNLQDETGGRIKDLRLSGAVLAGIFTGKITKWTDPAIKADNGGRTLPNINIIPVIRSDGSGTSAQFSAYIFKRYPEIWAEFANKSHIANAPTSFWPEFPGSVSQSRSDGVANYVAQADSVGAINYVEVAYAISRGFPVAQVKNQAGNYALPSAGNVAVALTHASFNADKTQNLDEVYTAPEASAYPISSYSYMITPTDAKDLDPAKGKVLGEFILYFACEGQKSAERLGYSPLPPNLVQGDFDAVRRIPGAPEPPPLSACDNPTIKNGAPPPATGATTTTGARTGGGATATPKAQAEAAATAAAAAATKTQAGSEGALPGAKAGAVGAGDPSVAGSPAALAAAEAAAAVGDAQAESDLAEGIVGGRPLPRRSLDPDARRKLLASTHTMMNGHPVWPYLLGVLLLLAAVSWPLLGETIKIAKHARSQDTSAPPS